MRAPSFCAVAAASAIAGIAAPVSGQAFSIDFGFQRSVPGPDFTGASQDQGGVWLIPSTNGNIINFERIFDITGDRSDVTLTSSRALTSFGTDLIVGDEDLVALVADGIILGGPSRLSSSTTLTWSNMRNGLYEVYTYTTPFSDFEGSIDVTVNGETKTGGGGFPDVFFEEGISHTKHVVEVTDRTMVMGYQTVDGFGTINGLQIVPIPAPAPLAAIALGAAAMTRRRRGWSGAL